MKLILKETPIIFKKEQSDEIIYKKYWKRASGQYILLRYEDYDFLDTSTVAQFKAKLKLYLDFTKSAASTNEIITCSRGKNTCCYLNNGNEFCFRNFAVSNSVSNVPNLLPNDYEFYINNENGIMSVNGTNYTYESVSATSRNTYIALYADAQQLTAITASVYSERSKFSQFILLDPSGANELINIRPAIVNGSPCLYDSISKKQFYSADGSTLQLSD